MTMADENTKRDDAPKADAPNAGAAVIETAKTAEAAAPKPAEAVSAPKAAPAARPAPAAKVAAAATSGAAPARKAPAKRATASRRKAPKTTAAAARTTSARGSVKKASAKASAAATPVAARETTAKAPTRVKAAARVTRQPAATRTAPAAAARAASTGVSQMTTKFMNEGIKTMFNDTNFAERVQSVFGDVNERAKTTIERNTRVAEELTELGRGNVEAVVASTKVAARGIETLGQEVAEFGRKSFEDASAALKSLSEVKSPADFFRLQSDFARSQFDALVSESSKLSETVIKLAGEVAEPITNRATVAAERVRTAVAL